ncbi:MAG: Rne/Rng family ribonuclease [Dysgonamonadaceae bacterium]|nr:Rne/Rng family ribonuclease [Dysgonamonadaceae bacterium]
MVSELVIDVQPTEISIAVIEDKKLVEFQKEPCNVSFAVGDIYLGKVKKLMPGLNAAFVDVGYKKEAFLHYQDLGANFKRLDAFLKATLSGKKVPYLNKLANLQDIGKEGLISDVLNHGDGILVQIAKEPISTKGPRLTSEISFAGRFLVAMPFGDKISVSTKIKSSEERARLKQLIHSIKPKNFSVIVRTSAEGIRVAELDSELKSLVKRWDDNMQKLLKAKVPALIYEERGRAVALLRDIFNPTFENIRVNDENVANEIRDYIHAISPDKTKIVDIYKGELPIFDNFSLTKQIKTGFGKYVVFKNGAYLVIEHTEAMHVIDVNSGNRARTGSDQEETAYEVNLAAAEEIARQLRLRDMGGIIVIDFIDLHDNDNRQKLYEQMRAFMENDRAKHNILQISKFGLMQITRQRVRPVMDFNTSEVCPTCFGKGEIKASILFIDEVEKKIQDVIKVLKVKKFKLYVHPYIAAYINKGIYSLKWKWKFKYSLGMRIIPSQSLGFLEYKFFDMDKNELDMKDESLSA